MNAALLLIALLGADKAAPPAKAIIRGPTVTQAGDLFVLDARESTGLKFKWYLINSKKTFLAVDRQLGTSFKQTGKYIFAFVATSVTADGEPDMDVMFWEVDNVDVLPPEPRPPSPDPDIPPVPPGPVTPPDPATLPGKAYQWIMELVQLPPPERKAAAVAMVGVLGEYGR